MRVLIIDDGQSGKDLAHHLKTFYGAEAFLADRLTTGLQMARDVTDLDDIVLDLSLPDSPSREDTVACIPKLKAHARVWAFTGYDDRTLLTKCIAAGAEDWFLKGPYRDQEGRDRGSAALASKLGSLALRHRKTNGNTEQVVSSIVRDRKTMAETPADTRRLRGGGWFSTANAVITLGVLIIVQLIALGGFMYSQGGSNALFRDQVGRNTNDIAYLKQRDEIVKIENKGSIDQRAALDKRQDKFEERMNGFDAKIDGIKTDVANIPWKVRDLISEQPTGQRK